MAGLSQPGCRRAGGWACGGQVEGLGERLADSAVDLVGRDGDEGNAGRADQELAQRHREHAGGEGLLLGVRARGAAGGEFSGAEGQEPEHDRGEGALDPFADAFVAWLYPSQATGASPSRHNTSMASPMVTAQSSTRPPGWAARVDSAPLLSAFRATGAEGDSCREVGDGEVDQPVRDKAHAAEGAGSTCYRSNWARRVEAGKMVSLRFKQFRRDLYGAQGRSSDGRSHRGRATSPDIRTLSPDTAANDPRPSPTHSSGREECVRRRLAGCHGIPGVTGG